MGHPRCPALRAVTGRVHRMKGTAMDDPPSTLKSNRRMARSSAMRRGVAVNGQPCPYSTLIGPGMCRPTCTKALLSSAQRRVPKCAQPAHTLKP